MFDLRVLTQDWHPADHASFAGESRRGRSRSRRSRCPYGTQVSLARRIAFKAAKARFPPGFGHRRCRRDRPKGISRQNIDSYSAFFENDHKTPTGLSGYLRECGVETVVLAGLATDFCVRFSAVDAAKLGFDVKVVTDACRAIDLDGSLDAAMRDMADHGVDDGGERELRCLAMTAAASASRPSARSFATPERRNPETVSPGETRFRGVRQDRRNWVPI